MDPSAFDRPLPVGDSIVILAGRRPPLIGAGEIGDRYKHALVESRRYASIRFINALTVVGSAGGGTLELDEPEELTGDAFEGLTSDPAPAVRAPRAATARPADRGPDRNTEIRRLALLKAAAGYAAPRADMTADAVLAVAILWEAWITEAAD